jgi:nitroreductase
MILDIIKNRRSVFPVQYNGKPIPKEAIETVLEAANWAPTHKKTEPWRFKVVRGEALTRLGDFMAEVYEENEERPKRMKIKKLRENPQKAGAIIVICMQRNQKDLLPEWEEIAATAMAVQNMWLCCAEMGIGSYWSSPGIISQMDRFFDLDTGERCLGLFYMGYTDMELMEGVRQPIEDKVMWLDK